MTVTMMLPQGIEIRQSTLRDWTECREKFRLGQVVGLEPIAPNIHYHFGSVIHKMAECYWSGQPYMEAFSAALKLSQTLDIRLLGSTERTKWVGLCESIAPITTVYYGFHGEQY